MNKTLLISSIFFLLLISAVFSVKPTTQLFTGSVGLELKYPQREFLKLNNEFKLHTHVYNLSNGLWMSNETVKCFTHLYNTTGYHILEEDMIYDENGLEFDLVINAGNFSKLGMYTYILSCNSSEVGGFVSGNFEVTNTGKAVVYTDNSMGLAILIFISLLTIPFFVFGLNKEPVLKPEVADFLVKKSTLFLGLIFLLFDTSIILTLASNAHLGISRELFRIMWLIQLTIYPTLIYVVVSAFLIGMKMFKLRKSNKRMGIE